MPTARRFPKPVSDAVHTERMLGIQAGKEHRFTGIWAVVVGGRVFVRSWTMKRDGWYHTLLTDPLGSMSVGGREVRMRARRTRSERLLAAVDAAYEAKYHTPASRQYVRGFARGRRRETTTELLPR
ncbi:MAG: DUF2255 family protein [Acidobacteriota bacterium]